MKLNLIKQILIKSALTHWSLKKWGQSSYGRVRNTKIDKRQGDNYRKMIGKVMGNLG